MKNFILMLFLGVGFNFYTQTKPNTEDTNTICLPVNIAKEILTDLNELDKQKEVNKTYELEIQQLNNKIEKLTTVNTLLEDKEALSSKIIKSTEQKVKLLEDENKNLRQDISNIKTKNTLLGVFSGTIIGALTYIIIVK